MSDWVYLNSEAGLWTVGYYTPGGDWVSEGDHESADSAADRVFYLNGGQSPVEDDLRARIAELEELIRVALDDWPSSEAQEAVSRLRVMIKPAAPKCGECDDTGRVTVFGIEEQWEEGCPSCNGTGEVGHE